MQFLVNPKTLLAIYNAGRRQGEEEASSYYWARSMSSSHLDELEDCFIWNDELGLCYQMDYDAKITFWNKIKKELENAIT
jgi:hypothetical protein